MIEILLENSDFIACVKPVGVQSQCDGAEDMVKLLKEQAGSEIFPIHRLDTNVGGTMIFAKNKKSATDLSALINNRQFEKTYLAVAEGIPQTPSGTFEDLLYKDKRKNKSFVVKRERKGVRRAVLDYNVLKSTNDKSLVSVRLHTGRSHQIRVQFASRKMPLAGDGKYGSRDNGCKIALWSHRIEFKLNGRAFCFRSYPDTEGYPWNLFNYDNYILSEG